jgi:hypothetical protein
MIRPSFSASAAAWREFHLQTDERDARQEARPMSAPDVLRNGDVVLDGTSSRNRYALMKD